MMMESVLSHLLNAVFNTGLQLVSIMGVFFVLGAVIHFQERIATRRLMKTMSPRSVIYSTGWLGTPVHELSHALACIIFLHKIDELVLFKPDPETGTLGYVYHRWNHENPYQVIGNFFIGIAPLLGGSAVIYLAYRFFIQDLAVLNLDGAQYEKVLKHPSVVEGIKGFFTLIAWIAKRLFVLDNFKSWQFWVFLYVVFCVGMHMAPSRPDLQSAFRGFIVLVIMVFAVNLAASYNGWASQGVVTVIQSYLSPVAAIMLLAVVINSFTLVFTVVLSNTIGRL